MTLTLKTTEDGSTTLYHKELDEHYHSTFGAIQEATHVYINAGMLFMNHSQYRILEIGFGTGLNALLTQEVAEKMKKQIYYCSIEKYPLSDVLVKALDFGLARQKKLEALHQSPWGKAQAISPHFTQKKVVADLHQHLFKETFDLIYYDAFAPDKQPDMWEIEILQKVTDTLSPGGILVTYSTKGIVKERLRTLGMEVKRLKGAKGKKDMLRCIKKI